MKASSSAPCRRIACGGCDGKVCKGVESMTTEERRQELLQLLTRADGARTGTELAKKLGVSRQIIVGDVSILRAEGAKILSTPRGYRMLEKNPGVIETVTCRHTAEEMGASEEELYEALERQGVEADWRDSRRPHAREPPRCRGLRAEDGSGWRAAALAAHRRHPPAYRRGEDARRNRGCAEGTCTARFSRAGEDGKRCLIASLFSYCVRKAYRMVDATGQTW